MKTTKQLLNEIAIAHLDRKTQEELQRLRAIAEAARVVAESDTIQLVPGGKDLVSAVQIWSLNSNF